MTLIDYLRAQDAIKAELVQGPNGRFVSAVKDDGSKFTLPVSKNHPGKIADMHIVTTEDGQPIATAAHYEVTDSITL